MNQLGIIPFELCSGCGACVNICPRNCISMKEDKEGFLSPFVEREICVECGLCSEVCPVHNKRKSKKHDNEAVIEEPKPQAFAMAALSDEIRANSSSGGAFRLIAEQVLMEQGVVFGAAFSEDAKTIKHIAVESKDMLWKICGSKYVQSEIGNSYRTIMTYLKEERTVLFSGTPCQVAGLKKYLQVNKLRREFLDRLICIDMVCHGVPAPTVYRDYIEFIEKKYQAPVKRVLFRDKSRGWFFFHMTLDLGDGRKITEKISDNLYLRCSLISNACLRSSCHNCQFKEVSRMSDITVADLWGIDFIKPEWNDDKGVSAVIIQSETGKVYFEKVLIETKAAEIDVKLIMKYNPNLIQCEKAHRKRALFLQHREMSFDRRARKYAKPLLSIRQCMGKIYRKFVPRR